MRGIATPEQGDAVERTAKAIMDAMERSGTANDANVCLAAVGGVLGCLAVACGDPAEAMAAVNAIAAGIIDGTLLD
jgi:hypothetical protein